MSEPTVARVMRSPLYPMLHAALRWRYVIITATAFAFCVAHLHARGDWEFFTLGSRVLFGQHREHELFPGGFRLYAFYPQIQIGPLALLAATPFRIFGDDSRGAVAVVLTAAAPLLVYVLERLAAIRFPSPDEPARVHRHIAVLVGGMVLAPSWSLLGTAFAHVDDVIVLAGMCITLWAVLRDRPFVLGVALGLAVAAKPWALIAFPLILALHGRGRWKAGFTALGLSALAWLPFIVADHYTLEAIRVNTDVSPASVIHLFGVGLDEVPSWIRSSQLVCSLIVGVVAVWRGRWAAVPAVAIATRLVLDPGTWGYYSSGLILACLAWDLLRSEEPAPTWTLASFCLLDLTTSFSPTVQAVLRLVVTVALIVSVVVPRRARETADAVLT